MRNIGLIGSLLFVAVVVSAACTEPVESTTAQDETDDAVSPRANCSIVEFCNASGTDGTVCKSTGTCSLKAAENECQTEAKTVCGTVLAPFIFENGSQDITLHVGECSGGALSCGGNCCSAASTFCSGTHCCDGTCKPGCPC
jgi:hypothetical protein